MTVVQVAYAGRLVNAPQFTAVDVVCQPQIPRWVLGHAHEVEELADARTDVGDPRYVEPVDRHELLVTCNGEEVPARRVIDELIVISGRHGARLMCLQR